MSEKWVREGGAREGKSPPYPTLPHLPPPFLSLFLLFASHFPSSPSQACLLLLEKFGLQPDHYQIGKTKVRRHKDKQSGLNT